MKNGCLHAALAGMLFQIGGTCVPEEVLKPRDRAIPDALVALARQQAATALGFPVFSDGSGIDNNGFDE